MPKIDINAPATLGLSLICLVVFGLDIMIPGTTSSFFTLSPYFDYTSPVSYLTTLSYVFGHGDTTHLIGNLSFILLLGPVLEERYGTKKVLIMMVITTLLTALLFFLFFNEGILGASGIVFMYIILVSFANAKRNSIPLTFILIVIIFLGKEVMESFKNDTISQTAHLAGGLCGSFFGFFMYRKS
jgi:membrane associated rhomboid family serine protease